MHLKIRRTTKGESMENDMKDQIREALLNAFSRLKSKDGCLFNCPIEEDVGYDSRKLYEVCINHRLANYLEDAILPILNENGREYSVDIEFNREGGNKKKLEVNGSEQFVRPDIIIHNRKTGRKKANFLVVECKKGGTAREKVTDDCKKIRAFMENGRYQYTFGLQVIYERGEIKGTLFYRNGQNIENEELVS
jgi:hypothetical protein